MERKIYDSMYIDAKRNFDRLNAKGLVGRNYTHILAMLMRCVLEALSSTFILNFVFADFGARYYILVWSRSRKSLRTRRTAIRMSMLTL